MLLGHSAELRSRMGPVSRRYCSIEVTISTGRQGDTLLNVADLGGTLQDYASPWPKCGNDMEDKGLTIR